MGQSRQEIHKTHFNSSAGATYLHYIILYIWTPHGSALLVWKMMLSSLSWDLHSQPDWMICHERAPRDFSSPALWERLRVWHVPSSPGSRSDPFASIGPGGFRHWKNHLEGPKAHGPGTLPDLPRSLVSVSCSVNIGQPGSPGVHPLPCSNIRSRRAGGGRRQGASNMAWGTVTSAAWVDTQITRSSIVGDVSEGITDYFWPFSTSGVDLSILPLQYQ